MTDEKTLQATTLVLGSDLDAIVKTSREQVLVFAQDMKTGKGRPGARVLVADGDEVILEAKTGRRRRPAQDVGQAARRRTRRSHYLVLDGADVAGSGLGVPEQGRAGAHRRGPTSTPTGRRTGPARRSRCGGSSARSKDGQYANVPGGRLPARSRRQPGPADRRPAGHALGVRHVPRDARRSTTARPVGTYRVRLYQPGKSEFAGAVRGPVVPAREDRPRVRPARRRSTTGARRSRPTSSPGTSTARPLAGRPIAVRLPDGRIAPGDDRRGGQVSTSSSRPRGSPRSRRSGSSRSCRRTTSRPSPSVDARGPRRSGST